MTVNRSIISRRRALSGAATAGIGVPLLAACGDDSGGGSGASSDPSSAASSSSAPPSSPSATRTRTRKGGSSEPAGDGIPTSDVPVGGGIVLSDEEVVITQPTNGEFRGFTAVCTHAQCLVTAVSDGTINCPCHGSQYSIDDGSVVGGPAPAALAAVGLSVSGSRITLA